MKTDITPDEAAYILARAEVRPGHAPSPVERSLAAKMRKLLHSADRSNPKRDAMAWLLRFALDWKYRHINAAIGTKNASVAAYRAIQRMQDAHRRAIRDRDPAILRLLDAGAIDPDYCLIGNDADDLPPG